MSQVSNNVGFSGGIPAPPTITICDVLPRICGGVNSCHDRVAVVNFKLPADVITYVEFCADTPVWSLWTFQTSRPNAPFTWECRAKVKLFKSAPGWVPPGTSDQSGPGPSSPETPAASYTKSASRTRWLESTAPMGSEEPKRPLADEQKANRDAKPRENGDDKRPDQRIGQQRRR
ncbi:hypothetical protein F5883DRAFT_641161 [Diaporthe sp. PMI_573]|nr:hypothetical protein F5883DRAFT_641161 [Diaporthaceae sp. PMI_573]